MSTLAELTRIEETTAFNLARWADLCADPFWGKMEGKVETDRFGLAMMTPPADFSHGGKQFKIGTAIQRHLPTAGSITVECPISTSDGVKVADVIWISKQRLLEVGGHKVLKRAPEICIEVLSPSNTRDEITEKRRLYFEAGAEEVWLCHINGSIEFFMTADQETSSPGSLLCPEMPTQLEDA